MRAGSPSTRSGLSAIAGLEKPAVAVFVAALATTDALAFVRGTHLFAVTDAKRAASTETLLRFIAALAIIGHRSTRKRVEQAGGHRHANDAPDEIGFCKSSKPERYQYSFQRLAANTRALLDHLGAAGLGIVRNTDDGEVSGAHEVWIARTFETHPDREVSQGDRDDSRIRLGSFANHLLRRHPLQVDPEPGCVTIGGQNESTSDG